MFNCHRGVVISFYYCTFITIMSHFQFSSGGEHLFDPEILKGLDWSSVEHCLSPFITNENPGESWLIVRPLKISDYDNGFLQILSQLTTVGNVSRAVFESEYELKIIFILPYSNGK